MPESLERQIYLLSPRSLSPETIAVTFAKTSRSPLSFREIAGELSDEQSAKFHEKWVVGYGHSSVAEHAVLHIAFENVSRLAIESIESNRLASYTEKSTRYQRWEPGGYHVPVELKEVPELEKLYRQTCDLLFETYAETLGPVRKVVERGTPPREGESQEKWDARIRSRYVDACRFLLPVSALANVGMTANARVLEHAIRKMLSHPLAEVRQIGQEVKSVATAEAPTLLKYAAERPFLRIIHATTYPPIHDLAADCSDDWLDLLAHDPQGESRVLAAAIYAQAPCSFREALTHVQALDPEDRDSLAEAVLGGRERFDVPPRCLEHAYYTFEARIDQGGYLEVKRHRMMTQTPQRLTPSLGYALPKILVDAGCEASFRRAMQQVVSAYARLAEWNPDVAAYAVPNAFNRRLTMTLNLREAFHFCELRSAPNAHFSLRRLALRMAQMIRSVHPTLAGYMRLTEDVDWRRIEADHFAQT
ncbi:MAG TPA: FAD-dependent thymidylate synthase [Anaerolineales bacterium]|nr:FAD-dependent thymidylate synthase [Anaerolineales bacterium]